MAKELNAAIQDKENLHSLPNLTHYHDIDIDINDEDYILSEEEQTEYPSSDFYLTERESEIDLDTENIITLWLIPQFH